MKREPTVWAKAVTLAIVSTLCLGFVAWAKMETIQLTYRIDKAMDTEDALAEEQRRLRERLAELRSPQRLGDLAQELGLGAAETGQIVVVKGEDGAADAAGEAP